MIKNTYVLNVLNDFKNKNKGKAEYIQACEEILESLELLINQREDYVKENILERFLEPERYIEFRVCWLDDNNNVRVNKGYRVQYNSAIGPYKGGLRFHPSVNESIIKFLGLEQCLKNSLTTLPMGGGKGGSDFDPKGKSDKEIMRFCQSFMNELYRHIGPNTDVPAGDIGVGAKEVGYLFGQYKKIRNEFTGALTGKGLTFGGSLIRKEATGYGLCYFTNAALKTLKNDSFEGKKVIISGSGNVAIYALEKASELGAKVIAMSDSNGWVYDENGIDLNIIKEIKEVNKGRIKEYLNYKENAIYTESKEGNATIWSLPCDLALPCATQNELTLEDAKMLVKNGVIGVFEGANMPTTIEAYKYLVDNNVIYGPGKAANAGGVAVSGLEMSQNSLRLSWSKEEVDARLQNIMNDIFVNVYNTSIKYGIKLNDLLKGANIRGFEKIADAMIAQGTI
jgi:glutamate dehydrogenase (NADP+)